MQASHAAQPESLARRRWALVVALVCAYLALHLALRWMRWPLFHGVAWGDAAPGAATSLAWLLWSLVPVLGWGAVLFAMADAVGRTLRGPAALLVLMFPALLVLDASMAWYQMALEHARLVDLKLLAFADWSEHLGVRDADYWKLIWVSALHVTALGGTFLLARSERACAAVPAALGRRRALGVALGVGLAVLAVDGLAGGWARVHTPPGWSEVARAHPLRPRALDGLWLERSERGRDMRAATRRLDELAARAGPERDRAADSGAAVAAAFDRDALEDAGALDVLLVMVESLNPHYIDAETMPFWSELAERGLTLERHYASGNTTHYGVLGLLYGAPVAFYDGWSPPAPVRSPFVEQFRERGYQALQLGPDLVGSVLMSAYLDGFQRPEDATAGDDWAMIPEAHRELQRPRTAPRLLMLFYEAPHFPYTHGLEQPPFQPEVPPSFDFSRGDLRRYSQEVRNRYRNCLVELDAWLEALLEGVDLERTIVVLTGDHGEEFFEEGRLGHSATLRAPQVRVPCVILAPGLAAGRVDAVTAHDDVMPTLVDLLGWEISFEAYGRSVLADAPARAAVVAHNRQGRPPRRWAVITDAGTSILHGEPGSAAAIRDLEDAAGAPASYRAAPDAWEAHLRAAARFHRALARPERLFRPQPAP